MADPVEVSPGCWRIRVFLNEDSVTGRQTRPQVTFRANGIRRARARAREIEDEQRAQFEAVPDDGLTVAAAAENWWALWCQRQRSPTTRKGYRSILDNHILAAPFATKKVDEVSTGDIERWYSHLATRPPLPAPPLAPEPPPPQPKRTRPAICTRQMLIEALDDQELAAMVAELKLNPHAAKVLKALATGPRPPRARRPKKRPARPPRPTILAVSPATVRRIHAVLTQIFDQCVRDRKLGQNPANLAHKPESRPKAKEQTSVETVLAVLEAAHRRSPVRSRLLAFAALTGLRRGELCGLRWSALDLTEGWLIVELNVVKAQQRFIDPTSTSRLPVLHVKDPKAHTTVGIALDVQARRIAAEQAEWQQAGVDGGDPYLWAVTAPYLTPLHPDTATNWFTQAAKDAGVQGVSLHDMRHWQGSQILEVGGTVQDVKERLRHKSLQTTMGYLHADHSKQRVLVDLLPPLELPPS